MNDEIVEAIEVILATIITGFGGYIFVKDILNNDCEEEG